ncbi:SH3 domain-containing protein [Erythrobacter sp. R86502]|uniref:SH3 domain-containing protein n=1 Tax=Erythrobacter sp. R86502 TaxID=3093846 RepID=UPI0036D22F04
MQGTRSITTIGLVLLMAASFIITPLRAQDRTLPYWASLRYERVNMRVGPSAEYPVTWVYLRQGLPVKVVRLREGWRLVEDHEGTRGWIAASQLDPDRGAIVIGTALSDVRAEPNGASALKWRAQPGVVMKLKSCRKGWCDIDIAGRKGWISASRLWGSDRLPGDE